MSEEENSRSLGQYFNHHIHREMGGFLVLMHSIAGCAGYVVKSSYTVDVVNGVMRWPYVMPRQTPARVPDFNMGTHDERKQCQSNFLH